MHLHVSQCIQIHRIAYKRKQKNNFKFLGASQEARGIGENKTGRTTEKTTGT